MYKDNPKVIFWNIQQAEKAWYFLKWRINPVREQFILVIAETLHNNGGFVRTESFYATDLYTCLLTQTTIKPGPHR